MPGPGAPEEISSGGRETTLGQDAAAWLRRHRRVSLTVAAVLTVATAGAAATAVVQHGRSAPAIPPLVSASGTVPTDAGESSWRLGDGGRPAAHPVVPLDVAVEFAAPMPRDRRAGSGYVVEVLGLEGPGIEPPGLGARAQAPTVVQPGGPPTDVSLRVSVACDALRMPVDALGYRLVVRARRDGRRTLSRIAAPSVTGPWARAVMGACAPWLGARHLTVTAARLDVDPKVSRLRATLDVANTGRADGLVSMPPGEFWTPAARAYPPVAARIPAGGSARVVADVGLASCDRAAGLPDPGSRPPRPRQPDDGDTTWETLGLIGLLGVRTAAEVAAPDPWVGQAEPLGIPLEPAARDEVLRGLHEACGGLRPVVTLVDRVTYERDTRQLRVAVVIDVTPGRVRDVTLVQTETGTDDLYIPTKKTVGPLRPSASGQVRAVLTYRAPSAGSCPIEGFSPPAFMVRARVAGSKPIRTVEFLQLPLTSRDPVALQQMCPELGP